MRPLIEQGAGGPHLLDAAAGGGRAQCGGLRLVGFGGEAVGPNRGGDDRGARPLHDVPSAMTVVIDTPRGDGAGGGRSRAAPVLKVKVDATDPAAQIRAVRAAAPKADLIVDPNESWDRALLEAMQPVLVEALVGLLEQPVPAGADEWLEDFTPAVPICADESVHVAADLRESRAATRR